jgi:shikimate kinase
VIELDRSHTEELARRRLHEQMRTRRLARHVAIAGFMGAGKSTMGQIVATRLARPFFDVDSVIEERTGRQIWEIFAAGEEALFRGMERALVRELLAGPPVVMSLGGGTLDDADTLTALLQDAFVVHLAISWPDVRDALGDLVRTRPMLQGRTEAEIHALYLRRQQTYRRAHLRLTPARDDVERAAERLANLLQTH